MDRLIRLWWPQLASVYVCPQYSSTVRLHSDECVVDLLALDVYTRAKNIQSNHTTNVNHWGMLQLHVSPATFRWVSILCCSFLAVRYQKFSATLLFAVLFAQHSTAQHCVRRMW